VFLTSQERILAAVVFQQTAEGTRHDPQTTIRPVPALFRKVNPKTGKRRNLGTFKSRAAAEKHERDVQYFKRH
jgi:hypothetical protein